jgi:hypothetical protein
MQDTKPAGATALKTAGGRSFCWRMAAAAIAAFVSRVGGASVRFAASSRSA